MRLHHYGHGLGKRPLGGPGKGEGKQHSPMQHPGHSPHFPEWTEAENKLLCEKYKECDGNWETMVPFFKSRFAKQLEFHHKHLTENATK
jgi:hypothetical protein